MIDNNIAHFSLPSSVEHLTNGVGTEFLHTREVDLIEKNIDSWSVKDRLDCLLLRALLQLSKNKPELVKNGFSAWDLVESVSAIRERQWSSPKDKERMSDDVRRLWNKLETLWKSKSEGIRQTLLDSECEHFPQFKRVEGGGTGRSTKYFIEWCKLVTPQATNYQVIQEPKQQNTPLGIRYICEDIKDPGFLARIFAEGFLLRGWRRSAYIAVLLAPVLIMVVIVLSFVLNIVFYDSLTKNQMGSFLTNSLAFFTIAITVYPMLSLKSKGILLAPWWMQSDDGARLLEFRKPPRFPEITIKAVSYSATCPICGAKVIAKSGGLEFFGRLIGRCDDAPVEHIFSFDHISRQGAWLRQ